MGVNGGLENGTSCGRAVFEDGKEIKGFVKRERFPTVYAPGVIRVPLMTFYLSFLVSPRGEGWLSNSY